MYRGPVFTMENPEKNQVEKAAGGEMICFLSHQVFSSEPKFYNETGARECCMLVRRGLSEND